MARVRPVHGLREGTDRGLQEGASQRHDQPTVTSSADINQKLSVALATGTGPDIMDNDASFYSLYYSKGVLEPLNLAVFGAESYADIIATSTRPGGLAAATFDGKVYALPYQGNSMSLFINNKEFRAAGLDPEKDAPKTWDDVIALGPKLKIVQGNRTVQKAFDFPYHSNRWEVQDLPAADRAVRRQAAERRRQDRLPQQPRGGEGADAVARRHQGGRRSQARR